jgi:hypothetical protein
MFRGLRQAGGRGPFGISAGPREQSLLLEKNMKSQENVEQSLKALIIGSMIMFISNAIVSFVIAKSISELRSEVKILREFHVRDRK